MYKNIQRGVFAALQLDSTDPTTVFTCPAGYQAEVIVSAYNEHTWAIQVTVWVTEEDGESSFPIFGKSIATLTGEVIPNSTGNKICLAAWDSIQVTAATADKIDVVVTWVKYKLS